MGDFLTRALILLPLVLLAACDSKSVLDAANVTTANPEAAAPTDPALPRAGLYRETISAAWLSGSGEIAPPTENGTICIPTLDLESFASWAAGHVVPRCPSDVTLGKGSFQARAACTDPEYGDIDVTSHANYSPDSIDVASDLTDGTDTMRIDSAYRRVGDC